jgi:hypothetical protein
MVGLNIFLSLGFAIYAAVKKGAVELVAGVILAFGWIYIGIINSVV